MLVLKRCLVRQLCRHPEVSVLCLLAGILYIYTIFSSSGNPNPRVLHPRFNKDPVMDKAITGLSELTPNNFDEPRPVSPITLESQVTQKDTGDVIPAEVTIAEPIRSHVAQSPNSDVKPAEGTIAEPIRIHVVQNQNNDVKPAEGTIAEPIRSHVVQSQNNDVKPAEGTIAEPIRSHVAQSQNSDVKPAEVTIAEPIRSHVAQSQNNDVKPAEGTVAEPIRIHAVQSQNIDVKPSEETTAEPIRIHAVQSQNIDVKPSAETTAETTRSGAVKSQNYDVKPAEETTAEPTRSHAVQSQNDDVKPTEEITAEPIKSHAVQSQNDDVKPAEVKTADSVRGHAAQSQNDDVKPTEEITAEPIKSHAVQSQNDDVKPAEVKTADSVRGHAAQSQNDDVKPAEETTAEPKRSHLAQSQNYDVKPAEETTAETVRSHLAQSQNIDVKQAVGKRTEPIRSNATQSQNDDVKVAEETTAVPIRSHAAQSQNDDVKPFGETTTEPIRSHAVQNQNDDVKPAEETTTEPMKSHAAQSQDDDVKPTEETTAETVRSHVTQSQNNDVMPTELTMANPSLQTKVEPEEEDSYTQEKKMEMPGGDMKCEANESCQGFRVESPEQAKIVCNKYGSRCKGFVYSLKSGKFILKGELTDKLVFSTEHDLYVKSDFAQSNKTLQHGSCAVPLDQFQSFSDGCRLPELDPNDESIIQLISRPTPIQCPSFQLTRYEGGVLELTDEISNVDNITAITYQPILRPDHKDWGFVSGDAVNLQTHETKFQLGSEFVRVQLSTADGKKHVEYHAQVIPRSLTQANSKEGLPLSVVVIGFDSLSAAHFQRALPEAYKFMSEELNSLFLKGYSVVGDGTTPALTALMTGKFESELPEARRQFPDTASLDRWPHIFKEFKEKGYATLFSEDCPAYGAFNYRLHGFTEPPTDHFSRFFWEAAHLTSAHCIHSKKQHRIHFDYMKSFLEAYRGRPKFGLFFLTDISHNNLKSIYHCADDFSALLRDLSEENLLNDTLLVVMSDHGFRYGDTRATFQGKLEERLPIMSLTFPRWFLQQYPELIHNLKENTDIVTSPFDLYATFKHVLSYPQAPANLTRGESLLTTINQSRNCEKAGVAEHYCPCIQWKEIDTRAMHVQRAAQVVVDHVNNLTASDPLSLSLCSRLEIDKVSSAYQKLPNIKVAQFLGSNDVHGRKPIFSRDVPVNECLYQVQIQTVPGNGLYEASVNVLDGKYRVTGDISRINLYGEQPRCILEKRPDLRKFCLCKDYGG